MKKMFFADSQYCQAQTKPQLKLGWFSNIIIGIMVDQIMQPRLKNYAQRLTFLALGVTFKPRLTIRAELLNLGLELMA